MSVKVVQIGLVRCYWVMQFGNLPVTNHYNSTVSVYLHTYFQVVTIRTEGKYYRVLSSFKIHISNIRKLRSKITYCFPRITIFYQKWREFKSNYVHQTQHFQIIQINCGCFPWKTTNELIIEDTEKRCFRIEFLWYWLSCNLSTSMIIGLRNLISYFCHWLPSARSFWGVI